MTPLEGIFMDLCQLNSYTFQGLAMWSPIGASSHSLMKINLTTPGDYFKHYDHRINKLHRLNNDLLILFTYETL
jgi:hypothetical protein